MSTGAKHVKWHILVWLIPLQILIFGGFQIWLGVYLAQIDAPEPQAGEAPPTHAVHLRTVQLAVAIVSLLVILASFLVIRQQLERFLRRPLIRLIENIEAFSTGQRRRPLRKLRLPGLTQLSETLNDSARLIRRQQREIEENARLAGVGQTVAGLSHTLKNVLNGLRAGQFVLDRAVKSGNQEKLKKGLEVTRSSVIRIENLIFDMLSFVKEREPKREPLDVNDVIAEVVRELAAMAESRAVEIRAEPGDDVEIVALDRIAIYRVLMDLATNAIDACNEGGRGDLVVVGSRGATRGVLLSVADNGVGMTPEVQKTLYTRFVSTKASGGTGLGMVVVKKIVDEHGGRIRVESAPEQGTTFTIFLPEVAETAKPAIGIGRGKEAVE